MARPRSSSRTSPPCRPPHGSSVVLARVAGVRDAYPELQGQGCFEQLDRVRSGEAYHASDSRVLLDRDGDGETEEAFFSLTYRPLLAPDGSVSGIVTCPSR